MNATQVLQIASLLAGLAPVFGQIVTAAFATVRAVEAVLPQATGAQKFDAAVTQMEAVFGALVSEASPVFTAVINGAVSTLNAIGEFKSIKSGTAPTPPATGGTA